MFPQYSHPKLDCRSSIFREAVCCIKDGISALHTLKSETKMSLPATSLAFPVSIQEPPYWRLCPEDAQEIRGLAPYHHFAHNPTSKGLPNGLALGPGIWNTSFFAYRHLTVQGGTHQLCPPQMPLNPAVTRKRQKRPFSKPFAWRAPGRLIWQVLPSDFLSGDHGFGSGTLG